MRNSLTDTLDDLGVFRGCLHELVCPASDQQSQAKFGMRSSENMGGCR